MMLRYLERSYILLIFFFSKMTSFNLGPYCCGAVLNHYPTQPACFVNDKFLPVSVLSRTSFDPSSSLTHLFCEAYLVLIYCVFPCFFFLKLLDSTRSILFEPV
ncbi:hypothetical protein Hdeb2414_s0007g00256181 [Helianthus debilis subsp. tardiflorus]